MCDIRKGTSTRKPRLNAQLVAQQVAQQFAAPPKEKKERIGKKDKGRDEHGSTSHSGSSHKRPNRPPRLKNIDRSSGVSMEVTVNNVTVVITDYKPKKERTSFGESNSHSKPSASQGTNNTGTTTASTTSNTTASSPSSDTHMDQDSDTTSSPVKSEINGETGDHDTSNSSSTT